MSAMPPEETIATESLSTSVDNTTNHSDVRESMLDTFPITADELDHLLNCWKSYSSSSSSSSSSLPMSLSEMLEGIQRSRSIQETKHMERLRHMEETILPESSRVLQQAIETAFVIGGEYHEPSIASQFKFLEGLSCLLGRRGSRCLLQTIYATAQSSDEPPEASSLVDVIHRLILASQDLMSSEPCNSSQPTKSPPQAWINSLQYRAKGATRISFAVWNDWVNSVAPQVYQALSTYIHYSIFTPFHPFRSTCPPLALPELHDSESAVWKSSYDPVPVSLAMLSPELGRGTWNRLYSSDVDSTSFPALQQALLGYRGATVMIIQTVKGDVFGYYSASPWRASKDWFGGQDGEDSYLFGIKPTLHFYANQGTNPHCMYLNNVATSRTDVLKGLAIGGIDKSSPRVHITPTLENCKAAAIDGTYECGPLLSEDDIFFDIDVLEIWAISSSVEEYRKCLKGGQLQMAIHEGQRIKAAQVDRKQFLEDFQTGQYANKLFTHREDTRGRHSFVADDDGKGYFLEDNPPTPRDQQLSDNVSSQGSN